MVHRFKSQLRRPRIWFKPHIIRTKVIKYRLAAEEKVT